jgi:hypothetical protein
METINAIEEQDLTEKAGRHNAAERVLWGHVALFIGLAYGLSWLWWAPILLPQLGTVSLSGRLPDLTHNPAVERLAFGMFGPLLAAVIMRLVVSRDGIKGSPGILRPWLLLDCFCRPSSFHHRSNRH